MRSIPRCTCLKATDQRVRKLLRTSRDRRDLLHELSRPGGHCRGALRDREDYLCTICSVASTTCWPRACRSRTCGLRWRDSQQYLQRQGQSHPSHVSIEGHHRDYQHRRQLDCNHQRLGLGRATRKQGARFMANFGDGAANIGAFTRRSTGIALAVARVFVCQNNRYAEHTRMPRYCGGAHLESGGGLRNARRACRRQRHRGHVCRRAGSGAARPRGGWAHLDRGHDLPISRSRLRRSDAYMSKEEKAAALAA